MSGRAMGPAAVSNSEASAQASDKRWDIIYPALSCVILSLCLLTAKSYADSAFNDDWSYSRVALKLSETGHIQYNGWGSPVLLFQSFWALPWIRAFGFSFNLLRAVTLPISFGFVILVYGLGREAGLRQGLACFGSILAATSPLFVPLAASFMTDPYGCFFTAVCLYAALRANKQDGARSKALWLLVLTLSGIVGGADRQTVWVAPFSLIPYLAWRESNQRFRSYCVVAFLSCVLSVLVVTHYFRPPYAAFDLSPAQMISLVREHSWMAGGRILGLILTCALLAMPALLSFSPFWRRMGGLRIATLAVTSICGAILLIVLFQHSALAPFIGNILSPNGILEDGRDMLGRRQDVMSISMRFALTAAVLFTILALRWTNGNRDNSGQVLAVKPVFGAYALIYLAVVLPGALLDLIYDRYALTLLPLAVIVLLLRFQTYGRNLPFMSWLLLGIFALYATATTHDYYARLRARTSAAEALRNDGVSDHQISAGFEHDGWTQLQLSKEIAGNRYGDRRSGNDTDTFWFWYYTKSVNPEYVVTYSETELHQASEIPVVVWLPRIRTAFVGVQRRIVR